MIPTFTLNYIFFSPNRFPRILIEKYLHLLCATSFMYEKGTLYSFGDLFIFIFSLWWDLVDPIFTEDWYTLASPHPPLMQNLQQDPFSLPFMTTKVRNACSNRSNLSKLWTQENKRSTSQNVISLNNVSCIHFVRQRFRDPNWINYLLMWSKRGNPDLSRLIIFIYIIESISDL